VLVSIAWLSLGDADSLASVLTFLSLVLGALFYSGVLWPIRLTSTFAKVLEDPNDPTKNTLLFEAHIFNRTRYEQTLREVVIFEKPRLGSPDRPWWRPIRWRRRTHELRSKLTDDRNPERVRLGDRGDETSRIVRSRGVLIVRIHHRQPLEGTGWTEQALESRRLYVGATFDARRSACRRVRVDNSLVNPFASSADASSPGDLTAARLAAIEAAAAAAAAAAPAANTTSVSAQSALAALRELEALPSHDD
jgi:hypothetical protein